MKTKVKEKTPKATGDPKQPHWHEMNRKQRLETMRKIQSEDLGLEMVHPDAAGILTALNRKAKHCTGSASLFAILKAQRASVAFGDLTAQHEADSHAIWFRRKKRNKQVCTVRQTCTLILDEDFNTRSIVEMPPNRYATIGFERGVDSISDEVDQKLLNLIRIGADDDIRSAFYFHCDSGLKTSNPLD